MRRRIVLFGPTGRTGRVIAGELAGRSGLLLAGRDRVALEAMGQQLDLPVRLANTADLGGVLLPGDVLLSCVGPYDEVGRGVVATAIRCAATYIDVSGEPAFLRHLHHAAGPAAAAAGVTLVPSVGYEYLPGQLLAEQVVRRAGGAADRVEVAYLAEGGLDAASASGRRSLVRALTRPTTGFHRGRHRQEPVGARRGRFVADGRRWSTISLGGAEVWSVPARHPGVRSVDVHTGWFGGLGPLVGVATRAAGPARRIGVDRVLDAAVAVMGDGDPAGLSVGTSRFVARARGRDGLVIARAEAVGGNPIVLAGRLAAGVASAVADLDLRTLPVGVTDPVTVLGRRPLGELAEWAGLIQR